MRKIFEKFEGNLNDGCLIKINNILDKNTMGDTKI